MGVTDKQAAEYASADAAAAEAAAAAAASAHAAPVEGEVAATSEPTPRATEDSGEEISMEEVLGKTAAAVAPRKPAAPAEAAPVEEGEEVLHGEKKAR